MNIVRKINSIALNAYQMIYNVVLLTLGIGAIGLYLYLLVMCSTPWNGIDHNDLIGLFVIGIVVGIVMIIVVPFLILLLVAMAGSIVSIIMLFISKKRSTGLIFALLNTFSIAFCAALCGFAAFSFTAIDILEGFWKVLLIIVIVGEVLALLWSGVGLILHLCTDIPYLVAEKKEKES